MQEERAEECRDIEAAVHWDDYESLQDYTKLMDFMEDLACQVKGIHVYEAKCSGFYLNYQIMVRYGLGPLQLYDQLEKKAQNFELGHQTKETEAQKNWIAYTLQV